MSFYPYREYLVLCKLSAGWKYINLYIYYADKKRSYFKWQGNSFPIFCS